MHQIDQITQSSFDEFLAMTEERNKRPNVSFLRDLYDGRLAPAEQISPADPDYWRLCQEAEKEKERLKERLEEDAPKLEEMREKYLQAECSLSYSHFAYGFRLGARFMIEIFEGKE